ncbi:uncharacterized protein yc1106_07484 [Curvularia clavata]|uniref:GAT domain-containing protein n=1 Tax=Curvularia clavata TaxID=95742 RepID=A0A9Q8ZEE8_CURCL|nr:uncharacterized protein yc1106_07484 [Curvularia clavata]
MELKKRLNLGSLMRKRPCLSPIHTSSTTLTQTAPSPQEARPDANADTPEANAARGVRLFCESGAANSGEEVLHLPTIVESAVASPAAAAAAARQIRTFLSKEYYTRAHVQYNAIMLIRILADNPGPSFTKNLDKPFADTVKHLLRNGQDPSVAQITKETLDSLEREKGYDANLSTLFAMYKKEKGLMASAAKQFSPRTLNAPGWSGSQNIQGGFNSGSSRSQSKTLPPPTELAGRIEEARTSAKLLLQFVQSTPPNELLTNDLVKEFAERCTAAQRSIQGYIACDSPAPDDDTMLTLIETNEQLSLAASKHQRAVLQARRLMGASPSPTSANGNAPPAVPPQSYTPPQNDAPTSPPPPATAAAAPVNMAPPQPAAPSNSSAPEDNPFADHYTSAPAPPNPRATSDHAGSPSSYNPGYHSTPSYLGRQESSANNLTMHGAQASITEEDEHMRPRTQRLQTPESNVPQQQPHDVSPIAERNTITYRY